MHPRTLQRARRHRRVRKRIIGFPERPRLCVFRSHKHLYVQLVDDVGSKTLFGCSTADTRLKDKIAHGGNVVAAQALGKLMAEEAVKRGVNQVVFDRGGYLYHGRVKALAEAFRAGGVQF